MTDTKSLAKFINVLRANQLMMMMLLKDERIIVNLSDTTQQIARFINNNCGPGTQTHRQDSLLMTLKSWRNYAKKTKNTESKTASSIIILGSNIVRLFASLISFFFARRVNTLWAKKSENFHFFLFIFNFPKYSAFDDIFSAPAEVLRVTGQSSMHLEPLSSRHHHNTNLQFIGFVSSSLKLSKILFAFVLLEPRSEQENYFTHKSRRKFN